MRPLLSIALGFFAFSLAAFAKPDDGRPPNIILFLADDMGWNGLGCYGSDLHETPHLDALAGRGMKFLDGYAACTVCSPTRAAAMTGMYPARLRVTNWITGTKRPFAKLAVPDWTMHLEHRHVTIAEVLSDAGYKTANIGKCRALFSSAKSAPRAVIVISARSRYSSRSSSRARYKRFWTATAFPEGSRRWE